MSIALQNQIDELQTKVQILTQQMQELTEALRKIESRHKPGPKPKNTQPQDMQ